MTPLPKRRHSHGRTHRRRAHDALSQIKLVECTTCHAMKPAHAVCPNCGVYRGMTAIEVESGR
jgi:large subunit ribosomal protein L32